MTERVLGPTGGRRRKRALLLAPLAGLALMLVLALGASGASLPGSSFEIDNPAGDAGGANLVVNGGAGALDWAAASVTQTRRGDAPTGTNDDSYQGGTKEDTVCPGEVTGSIPNNKSDLLEFGAYFEAESGGPGFLHVYWARVNDPSGTTNMDFEFNRSTTLCSNGPNVVRTAGDVLLQFDVDQGGAQAHLSRRTWDGSKWGAATALGTTEAIGAINQVAITAPNADGLGALSPRTFGEASFDLSAVSGGDDCLSFGSAMLKSRSSDSFTSQLKDFIRPIPVSSANCGAVKITKTYKHAANDDTTQAGVTFTIDGTDPAVTGVTNADGVVCFDGLALNEEISITETLPAGYSADQDLSQTVTPDNSASCSDASYGGETLNFGNTPLTNVTISVDSQVAGGTDTDVSCDNGGPTFNTTDSTGDGSGTASNLEPVVITCTINIDP